MTYHLCPLWAGYLLASPIRRLWHRPERILAGLVTPGMTVLEVGPGLGFFTLPLARMVGPDGRVVAVDVQEAMLRGLRRRAEAARLGDRIVTRACPPETLALADFAGAFDFALAFAVVHELPDPARFFVEVVEALRPEAQCLVAEPKGHVPAPEFAQTLAAAQRVGLTIIARPSVTGSQAALLCRGADGAPGS